MSIAVSYASKALPRFGGPLHADDLNADFKELRLAPEHGARVAVTFFQQLKPDAFWGQVNNSAEYGLDGWRLSPDNTEWHKGAEKKHASQWDPRAVVYPVGGGRRVVYRANWSLQLHNFVAIRYVKQQPADDDPHAARAHEFAAAPLHFELRGKYNDTHETTVVRTLTQAAAFGDIYNAAVATTQIGPVCLSEHVSGDLTSLRNDCTLDQAFQVAYATFQDLLQIYRTTRLLAVVADLETVQYSRSKRLDGGHRVSVMYTSYHNLHSEGVTVRRGGAQSIVSRYVSPAHRVAEGKPDKHKFWVVRKVNAAVTAFCLGMLVVDLLHDSYDPEEKPQPNDTLDEFVTRYATTVHYIPTGWSRNIPTAKRLLNKLIGFDHERNLLESFETRAALTMDDINNEFLSYFRDAGLTVPRDGHDGDDSDGGGRSGGAGPAPPDDDDDDDGGGGGGGGGAGLEGGASPLGLKRAHETHRRRVTFQEDVSPQPKRSKQPLSDALAARLVDEDEDDEEDEEDEEEGDEECDEVEDSDDDGSPDLGLYDKNAHADRSARRACASQRAAHSKPRRR